MKLAACPQCAMPVVKGRCPFRRWHESAPCKHGRTLITAAREIAADIDSTSAPRPFEQLVSISKAAAKHLHHCTDCQRTAAR